MLDRIATAIVALCLFVLCVPALAQTPDGAASRAAYDTLRQTLRGGYAVTYWRGTTPVFMSMRVRVGNASADESIHRQPGFLSRDRHGTLGAHPV